MPLSILHITNHPGTISNLNQTVQYLNQDSRNTGIGNGNITIHTAPWLHNYYVSSTEANQIFPTYQETIAKYDILIFTDTAMYARPFLQNLDHHQCLIIIYITNRFDWGLWNNPGEPEFYNLYHHASCNPRVRFSADNNYDQHYAITKADIHFTFPDALRITPAIQLLENTSNTTHGLSANKLFIQNRGTDITKYSQFLTNCGIQYDIFDANNRYRDKSHIREYLGVLHLPYQPSIHSIIPNLGYGIIHFLPSKQFLKELLATEWYYWEERNQCRDLLEQSIKLAEWYSPELAPCFIYFDNWNDLAAKYHHLVTNTNELDNKRQVIYDIVQNITQNSLTRWRELLAGLLRVRPCIVTMFYDIRMQDDINSKKTNRSKDNYFNLADQFILRLRIPLFICMAPDDHELYSYIMENRRARGLEHLTYCYREKFEDTWFHQFIPDIQAFQKNNNSQEYQIYNINIAKDTPRYITLNNNKFHFLERAITHSIENINTSDGRGFTSDRYVWMDMGINHVAQKPFEILRWIYKIPAKIKQMCINPYLEKNPPRDLFHNIFHHTAGGLFTGSPEYLLEYIRAFKTRWVQCLREGWYQLDEAVMTMVQRERRDMFIWYYGDYDGIIANYDRPDLSMNIIMAGIDKTRRYNVWNELRRILEYLVPYFEDVGNQYSGHFYSYVWNVILADVQLTNSSSCVEWDGVLASVRELIQKKLGMNDSRMLALLGEFNGEQLDKYIL